MHQIISRPLLRAMFLLMFLCSCSHLYTTSPPNILVISADDLGNHLGSYGDMTVSTPNIDSLAAQGTRFTRAYVTQSSCSSSRASFFTGLYPHQNGQIGLANRGFTLEEGWPLLPKVLKDRAGFFTALAGKLHVAPTKLFDFFDELDLEMDTPFTLDAAVVAAKAAHYFSQAEDKPFYVQFDLRDPHRPFHSQIHGLPSTPISKQHVMPFSWTDIRTSDGRADKADTADYYISISRLDSIVGQILLALEKSGKYDDTIIVFWSDNGPPFPRAKTTLFEQGTKVPLIIAGPGVLSNQSRDELVSLVDLFPTVEHFAGLDSTTFKTMYTGRDLSALLQGKVVPWRGYVFTESNFHTTKLWSPARAVNNGRWKLIERLSQVKGSVSSNIELYDLETDPDERTNVAASRSNQAVLDKLSDALDAWRASTDDPLLDASVFTQWRNIAKKRTISQSDFERPRCRVSSR